MSAPRLAPVLFSALCASALILTACGGDQTPVADPDRPCAAPDSLSSARTIDLAPAQVKLTDPGAQPRRPVAAEPRTDGPQRVTLSTSSRETSVLGGQDPGADAAAPTSTSESVTLPLTARTVCTDAARLELTLGAPTSPDTALAPQLPAFDGALAGVRYGPGLAPVALQLAPPAQAQAPATRAVEQSLLNAFTYAVPIPAGELGSGATWTVTRTVSAASTVAQTMTVTLVSHDGDLLVLDVSVDETPTEPIFRIPGSAQTLELTRYSNSGSGRLTVDLRTLLPQSGSLELTGARELVGDDPATPILQQTGLSVSWAPTAP